MLSTEISGKHENGWRRNSGISCAALAESKSVGCEAYPTLRYDVR